MPRNGSGVYSAPAGTLGTPNTVIKSAEYNAFVADLVSDANAARPITAGGTAGGTAVAGADNLSTKGTDIPSATTTDIGAATGRYVHITGTTTITGLGTKTAGVLRIVTFDGALTLTHNATSLILPGGGNIITAAGDVATFVSEGGGNWRCVSYSRASGPAYLPKAGNYTAVDADFDSDIRFSAAATLSIDVTANLRSNWRATVWAAGGIVTIDPNSTDTINGATTLVLQQGQTAFIYKTGATTFQANVYSDAMSGPQIKGLITGLTITNNGSDATNDIDIAVGSAASDTSPFHLITLSSAITKRIDASWAVGTNQGGLDTGAVGNGIYYIWEIQRSDTGVTDALISLSSTAPTMPANYDRKALIGKMARTAGVNNAPRSYSQKETTPWVPFTGVFTGFGTVDQSTAGLGLMSRRNGENVEIKGKFTVGTPTAVEARMTFGFNGTNSNIVSDATLVPGIQSCGLATYDAVLGVSSVPMILIESNVGYVTFGLQSTSFAGLTKRNGNVFASAGWTVSFQATIPISGW